MARLPDEWVAEAVRLGGRPFHGTQIFRWIHARGEIDPSQMTDLPATIRGQLAQDGLGSVCSVAHEMRATDGTRKLLILLGDGARVETVLIPRIANAKSELPSPVTLGNDADAAAADDDSDDDNGALGNNEAGALTPVTQCISTQVGCAMGCAFCASGVAGLKRHMHAGEIVSQVLVGRARLDPGERLGNIVLMGMGEPLHNYDATARALRLITHPLGIGISTRRVTVSTSGLVPEIARLGRDFCGQIGLAISLHAADDETRSRLLPINKKYPLANLMKALHDYPLPRRRRITMEYTLVAGQNDTVDQAKKLIRLLRGLPVKVNLIPMNPIASSTLSPPDLFRVLAFQRVLCDAGYSCFIRRRRGDEVAAACGQLAVLGAKPKVRTHRG
jgi:23S rRNA (adenine2503-C2)-methyltransferase